MNCLKFFYNMSGENLGRLNVYSVDQDDKPFLLWRLAGDQGNEWRSAQVPVDAFQGFKVSDEEGAERGDGWVLRPKMLWSTPTYPKVGSHI